MALFSLTLLILNETKQQKSNVANGERILLSVNNKHIKQLKLVNSLQLNSRKVNMGSTNIVTENIKKIFRDMFKQHQEAIAKNTKHKKMFRNYEKSIMQLISGNATLTNQRLDNFSKYNAELKESLEFTQEETKNLTRQIKHNGRKSARPQK